MNFSKSCANIIFLISSIVFSAEKLPNFCGYSAEYEELYYPIVNQQIISDVSLFPFLHCPWETFCNDFEGAGNIDENLKEWQDFFGNNISTQDITELIYGGKQQFYENLKNQKGNGKEKLASNIPQNLRNDFANYMLLAIGCEGIYSNNDGGNGWYQGENNDSADDKPKLLEQALAGYKNTNNTFLRNRYGFQIVRLSHYLQNNEAALRYFESMLQDTPQTHYIFNLALEQKSGAAYNMKKLRESILGYLEVYKNIPSRRRVCALSLKYFDWSNPQLADDFTTKENFSEIQYFFKSFYANGDISVEMNNLEKSEPNSAYLEVLAIREIDKLQTEVFNNGYYDWTQENNDETESTKKNLDMPTLKSLQQLAKRQIENKKVTNTDFWRIILAATYLKNEDYENGLKVVSKIPFTSAMSAQAKHLALAIEVLKLKFVDREKIGALYERLKNDPDLFSYYPISAFFFNKIAGLYRENDNIVIGTFGLIEYFGPQANVTWQTVEEKLGTNYNLNYKSDFVEENVISALQNFIDIPNKNGYEKLILSKLNDNPQDYAYDLKGTYLFSQNRLDEAIAVFKKVKSTDNYWANNIRPEIFAGAIREYFDTPFEKQSDKMQFKYKDFLTKKGVTFNTKPESYADNKLLLAQLIKELENMAREDSKNAADYYYMIGNAWYNMSNEGWFLNTLHYIGNDDRNHILGYNYTRDGEQFTQSVFTQTATKYFQKALNAQGNKETKAKATFMLAKTNYCATYTEGSNYGYRVDVCGDHKTYFESLKNEYDDTQFQNQVLKECSWYRVFIQN